MEISEIRVKLIANPSDRLKAFCSVTLDSDFVIRDIKIIEGGAGIFVAMPSRKLSDHCPKCGAKNHLTARYCNECAASLGPDRVRRDKAGRKKLHADIAHPINSACRQRLQEQIIEAFQQETAAAAEPGYKHSSVDDEDDDYDSGEYRNMITDLKRDAEERRDKRDRSGGGSRYEAQEPENLFDEIRAAVEEDESEEVEEADDFEDVDMEEDEVEESDESEPAHPVSPPRVVNDDFGAGLLEETVRQDRKPRKTPPAPPPPAPKKQTAPPRDEADDDFGSGIL